MRLDVFVPMFTLFFVMDEHVSEEEDDAEYHPEEKDASDESDSTIDF